MNISVTQKKIPLVYFLIPFLLQLLIILVIPSKSFYTYQTGQDVVIQTQPVDPYDFLRGYSQTLSYDISNLENLRKLPGEKNLNKGDTFYLTLQAPESSTQKPPLPWTAIAIDNSKPSNLPTNQIALKGIVGDYDMVIYGLETYYMPENQREKLNQEIQTINQNNEQNNERQSFVVEIKVDQFGNSIPVSLWIRDRNYQF
jgi:uncharacterized membrane-anchored protein